MHRRALAGAVWRRAAAHADARRPVLDLPRADAKERARARTAVRPPLPRLVCARVARAAAVVPSLQGTCALTAHDGSFNLTPTPFRFGPNSKLLTCTQITYAYTYTCACTCTCACHVHMHMHTHMHTACTCAHYFMHRVTTWLQLLAKCNDRISSSTQLPPKYKKSRTV